VPNLLTEDEPILKNVTGTEINWKSGQSLTFKKVTKKQRKKGGRGAGQLRTISKNERQESFFHFFSPPKMPALAEVMDEEEADAVEEAFDHDYDVAQAFRGCVIPKAVLWFTGEAMDEDYGDDLDGFIAGEDETDGGDDGDGSGGGATFGGTPGQFQFKFDGGAGSGAGGAPQPGADGENPECKQS
jgi:nucleosome assembly protein 1-like 1